jgi:hypothetical protein
MLVRLPSGTPDNRVTIRLRISTGVAESLYDEATHRRVPASSIAERLLRAGLPELAEERVRDRVYEGILTVITDETSMPSTRVEGTCDAISPKDSVALILPGDGEKPDPGGHADPP